MFKNRILHIIILALFMAIGIATKNSACSPMPGFSPAHFEGTAWVITQVNEELIPTGNAPTIEIKNGDVFVNQGCHSFMMTTPDKTRAYYTEVSFIQSLIVCEPMTAQQRSIADVFRNFDVFSPAGDHQIIAATLSGHYVSATRQD